MYKSPIFFVLLGLAFLGCSQNSENSAFEKSEKLEISGTIELTKKLEPRVSEGDTIFLIARSAQGGPPLAVKRWVGKNYPYNFTLTNQDLMRPEQVPDEPLNLSVRVDKDGDAMSKNSGDLTGTYAKNPVPLRIDKITILVDEALP